MSVRPVRLNARFVVLCTLAVLAAAPVWAGTDASSVVLGGVVADEVKYDGLQYSQVGGGGPVPTGRMPASARPTNALDAALDSMLGLDGGNFVDTGNGGTGIVIGHNDQLWYISAVALGDPYQWRVLYAANASVVTNPNRLQAGTVLSTPDPGGMPLSMLGVSQYQPQTQAPRVVSGTVRRTTSGNLPWSSTQWVSPAANQQQQRTVPTQQQQQQTSGRFNSALPLSSGTVTSNFGRRTFQGQVDNHQGIDVGVARGTPIKACGAGVVTYSGWQGGYGRLVIVRHPDGTETYYAHCKETQVKVGQQVRAGQQVATVNSTGRSTGDHLHFEIRRGGRAVDPRQYFTFPAVGRRLS